jgi:hypothetical protein
MASSPTCAFCQRSGVKMTQEHVFPKWLSRAGSDAGHYILQRGSKTIRTPLIEVVTKRVCSECNSGWLGRIEETTKAALEPIINAAVNSIKETERWVISRWFTKTILTAQLAATARSEQGILHPQDYQTFFSHAQPFSNQFTLMWGYRGDLLPIRFEIHSPDETTNQGVRVFFHFHRIILVTYFMNMEKPTNIVIPHGFADGCHILWPSQRGLLGSGDPTLPVRWPPPYLVDAAGVDAILAAMAGTLIGCRTDSFQILIRQ